MSCAGKAAIKFSGMQSSGSESLMGGTGDRTKDELKGGLGVGASKTDFFTKRKVQHTTNST